AARRIPGDQSLFRVGDIDVVAPVDENAARAAELGPLVDEPAVLIESLNTVVVAVADEKPALGIEGEAVRLIELTGSAAGLAPAFDESPVLRELQDFRLTLSVSLGHENVAVPRN